MEDSLTSLRFFKYRAFWGDLTGYCHFQCASDFVDLPRVQLSYDDEIEIFK